MNRRSKHLAVWLLAILSAFLLTACQNGGSEHGAHHGGLPSLAPIEVEFKATPETNILPDQAVQLQVTLTQAGELVEDADLVRFEIWYKAEESESVDATTQEQPNTEAMAGHEQHVDSQHDHANDDPMAGYESEHEMIKAEHVGAGVYAADYHFEKSGAYFVKYHVDARDYHMMATNEVLVD